MVTKCFACGATYRLVVAICCRRPCCPSHRYGTGDVSSGFTCSDHPFGMTYEPRRERLLGASRRWWSRLRAWLFRGKDQR